MIVGRNLAARSLAMAVTTTTNERVVTTEVRKEEDKEERVKTFPFFQAKRGCFRKGKHVLSKKER